MGRTQIIVGFVLVALGWTGAVNGEGVDVSDITVEWTPAGKKLAAERAKLPARDEMVAVPAGWFLMGSDKKEDRYAYLPETPQRRVLLDAFEIDQYEATTVQFLKFVLATGRSPLIDWRYDGGNFQESMANHPVMHVSWRGEDGRLYPWGNQAAGLSRANFGRTGLSGPVRDRPERLLLYPPIISVDKYENGASPYGLFQMAGNVAEWVADWYDKDYYKAAPDRNPKGPEHGTQKGFRGGGWIDSTPSVRASQRNGTDPNTKMNWLGFRCARDKQR
jgi:iron(II)-dependent oxidoreductase